MSRSLPPPYKPIESTYLPIFRTNPLAGDSHLHQFTSIRTILRTLFLLFLPWLDNDFILIGHFKQCVQCRTTLGVLKIERYGQRLTQGYSAYGGSYSWAPDLGPFWGRDRKMKDQQSFLIHSCAKSETRTSVVSFGFSGMNNQLLNYVTTW